MQSLRALTVAPTCTFLHVALRASCTFIFQNDKWFVSPKPHTLLLLHFSITLKIYAAFSKAKCMFWMTGYVFDHSCLLNTTQPPPPCASCYRRPSCATPFFRYEMPVHRIRTALTLAKLAPYVGSCIPLISEIRFLALFP